MYQFFRIALWMCLCLGCLRANPLLFKRAEPPCKLDLEDVQLDSLQEVSCLQEKNMNLTSPINVEAKCHHAALQHFTEQLEKVQKNCTNTDNIEDTLDALQLPCLQETNCNLTLTVHETFANFKGAIKTFMERFNSNQLSAEQ